MKRGDSVGKVSWSKSATKAKNSCKLIAKDCCLDSIPQGGSLDKCRRSDRENGKDHGSDSVGIISKRQKIAKQSFKKVHSLKAVPPRKKKISKFRRKMEYWPDHLRTGQSSDSDG